MQANGYYLLDVILLVVALGEKPLERNRKNPPAPDLTLQWVNWNDLLEKRWNHNIHYHQVLLDALPRHADTVLDVGCGEGTLARELRGKSKYVKGIDLDEASIELARNLPSDGIDYIAGDFLSYPFQPASFDAVLSVATLHHVDAEVGLRRMAQLVRPGGLVGVIGLARDTTLVDGVIAAAGLATSWVYRLTMQPWEHPSPIVWPPPESWASMRRISERELPGCHFKRRLLWRYSILWRRPEA